jgi:hypothetical protein
MEKLIEMTADGRLSVVWLFFTLLLLVVLYEAFVARR